MNIILYGMKYERICLFYSINAVYTYIPGGVTCTHSLSSKYLFIFYFLNLGIGSHNYSHMSNYWYLLAQTRHYRNYGAGSVFRGDSMVVWVVRVVRLLVEPPLGCCFFTTSR